MGPCPRSLGVGVPVRRNSRNCVIRTSRSTRRHRQASTPPQRFASRCHEVMTQSAPPDGSLGHPRYFAPGHVLSGGLFPIINVFTLNARISPLRVGRDEARTKSREARARLQRRSAGVRESVQMGLSVGTCWRGGASSGVRVRARRASGVHPRLRRARRFSALHQLSKSQQTREGGIP